MKKTRLLFTAASIAAIFFHSCSKSGTATPGTSANKQGMSGSIAGKPFYIDSCIFLPYAPDPTYVEIFATPHVIKSPADSFPSMDIEIHPYNGMGTYTMSPNNTDVNLFTATNTMLYAYTGTVTITQTDPYVVGTFSFTATNGTSVTNGTFTAKP